MCYTCDIYIQHNKNQSKNMKTNIIVIIFYFLLIDSVSANIVAWSGLKKWYQGNFTIFSRYFPITKGWAGYYLLLVVFIAYIINIFVKPLF